MPVNPLTYLSNLMSNVDVTEQNLQIAGAVVVGLFGLLYLSRKYVQRATYTKTNRIDGKVVIITGANTGLGKATAKEMAKRGAKVYLACRDMQKCEEVKREIIASTNNPNVHARKLDLGSMESVRNFVVKFLEEEDHLDILINNAGLNTKTRVLTVDGFENTFAVNHLGHFLLTNLLLDTLRKSAPSRIVVVSSSAHMMGKIKRDNLMLERSFKQFKAYANSKLANILFTIHLDKLLAGSGVTVNSLHPGVVQTDIWRYVHWSIRYLLAPVYVFFLKTAESGAQTQIKLALDPDLKNVSGKYFVDCAETKPSQQALDLETAKWLWDKSAQLTGLERKQ